MTSPPTLRPTRRPTRRRSELMQWFEKYPQSAAFCMIIVYIFLLVVML